MTCINKTFPRLKVVSPTVSNWAIKLKNVKSKVKPRVVTTIFVNISLKRYMIIIGIYFMFFLEKPRILNVGLFVSI